MPKVISKSRATATSTPPGNRVSRPRSQPDAVGKVTTIRGDIPNLNEHLQQALDPETGLLYLYGGEKPVNPDVAELHVLDTLKPPTMECTNLSASLRQRTFDPWTGTILKTKRGLPVLNQPNFGFLAFELQGLQIKFLVLYGGYAKCADGGGFEDKPSSNIIVINISNHAEPLWWVDKIHGPAVQPPVNATMFANKNGLYFFGGTKNEARSEHDEPKQLYSYSIAEFVEADEGHILRWTAADIPYPPNVPPNTIFRNGVLIYDKTRILLTPGRKSFNSDFQFKKNMWLFKTSDHSFYPAQTDASMDNFPKSLRAYRVYLLGPQPPPAESVSTDDSHTIMPTSASAASGSRSLRAHPYPLALRPAEPPHPADESAVRHAADESAVICGWVDGVGVIQPDGSPTPIPELWNYRLVERDFQRLELGDDVLGTSQMLRFVIAKNRIFLLGDKNEAGDHDHSQVPGKKTNYLLNAYIEIFPSTLDVLNATLS